LRPFSMTMVKPHLIAKSLYSNKGQITRAYYNLET
jgi:hypothetical protein